MQPFLLFIKIISLLFVFQIIPAKSITFVYAKEGDFLSAVAIGGSGFDKANYVSSDASGNIYLMGSFQGTVDFNPGPGTFNLTSGFINAPFFTKLDKNGNFIWAKTIQPVSPDYSDISMASALGCDGNIYTTGFFRGTIDFDPGPGMSTLSSSNNSIYISKLNGNGNLLWAKAINAVGYNSGTSIAVDSSGNVYATGYFSGTVDFDPGSGVFYLTAPGYDIYIFICKFDKNGNFIWAKSIGGGSGGYVPTPRLTLDNYGNVYTTSFFYYGDFDPGPGTYYLTSKGAEDIFISKLNTDGLFVWAKAMGGNETDFGKDVSIAASGNVYTTGTFRGTADFDPGPGTFNLTSKGSEDIFICKLNSNGSFAWAKAVGGTLSDNVSRIIIDSSEYVYLVGIFEGTADFNPGPSQCNFTSKGGRDIFCSKINKYGNFVWAKATGGPLDDWGEGITIDTAGDIYFTGSFNDTADFDPGPRSFNLSSAGYEDIFITKLAGANTFVSPYAPFLPSIYGLLLKQP